jgi:DNA primase
MIKQFSDEQLRVVRNDIAIRAVIGSILELPSKEVEGVFRFLCPICNEFQTSIHPSENLGRCFRCQRNFNPIDIVMAARQLNFVASVKLLLTYNHRTVPQKQPLTESATALRKLISSLTGEQLNAERGSIVRHARQETTHRRH